MLAFLARYGHQSLSDLNANVPTVQLIAWVKHIEQILEEENKPTKR